MKEEFNKLMKEFIRDCEEVGEQRYPSQDIKLTFKNFIYWLDDKNWNMEE